LASGQSITLTLTATVDPLATGNFVNTATVQPPNGVTDPNLTNNTATDTDMLTPMADLALTKTDSSSQVLLGLNVTYLLVLHNHGPSAAQNVVVTDPLPAGLTFVSASMPSQGTFDSTTQTWNVGNLANGGVASIQITARVVAVGPLTNSASAASLTADPDLSNNVGTATVNGFTLPISKRLFLASSPIF
jgi:uncharacterized repeat protein (TIGR01451 family)